MNQINHHNPALSWKAFSDNRATLMCLATILVMFRHFLSDEIYMASGHMDNVFNWIYIVTPTGVPLFQFLSGVGVYFSLQRAPAVIPFLKKRYLRILPTYLLWGFMFWVVADIFLFRAGIREFLADFLLITLWTKGDHSFWFIGAICLFYLAAPLLHKLFQRKNRTGYLLIIWILSMGGCLLLADYAPSFYEKFEIILYRFPIFALGIYCGPLVKQGLRLGTAAKLLIVTALSLRILSALLYIFEINQSLVYCRPLMDIYSLAIIFLFAPYMKIAKNYAMGRGIGFVSNHSLELYLTHLSIWNLLCVYNRHGTMLFVFIVLLSILLSPCLSACAKEFVSMLSKGKENAV